MKAITPVIAITILILMAIAAAAMAYLMITGFQDQASEASTAGLETLSQKTSTQLKIESVSGGKIYLRNTGAYNFTGATFFVDGRPIDVSGPDACEPGLTCVFLVETDIECEGDCDLSMGADMPLGTRVTVEAIELAQEYSLTTFSDGSSSKTLSFTGASSGEANITLPIGAEVLSAALSATGSRSWSGITNISKNAGVSYVPKAAADASGNVHVVWSDDTPGNYDVYYCNWTAQGWSTPIPVYQSAGSSDYAYVAADPSGTVHIVWEDDTTGNREILYRNMTNGILEAAMNISSSSGYSGNPSVQSDASGIIHVMFREETIRPALVYMNLTAGAWSAMTDVHNVSLTDDHVAESEFGFDSEGNIHVVYYAYPNGVGHRMYYKNRTSGVWSDYTQLAADTPGMGSPAVGIDPSDRIYALWYETYGSGDMDIQYKNRTSGVWSPVHNVSEFSTQHAIIPRIAIDPAGTRNVVWQDYTHIVGGDILFRNQTDTGWQTPFNVSLMPSYRAESPDIRSDRFGNLHVVWNSGPDPAHPEIHHRAYTNPAIPSLQAGSTGGIDWTYPTSLNTTDAISDFSDKLTALLADCTCTSCWSNGTHCTIGLNLTTQSAGIIELSGLSITYS